MTAAITATAIWDGATALTRAVDGELAGMDSGPAPLATVLQSMTNRDGYALGATWNLLSWSGQMRAYGTAAVPVVTLGPGTVALQRNGVANVFEPFTFAAQTLGIADVEGLPANLAASTWYYVYAWNNAGVLTFQISTTPPTLAPSPGTLELWKRGAAYTHRYFACFVTDGAGNPLPVRRASGRYSYAFDSIAVAGAHRVLSGGAAIAWAGVSCTAAVPPHAFVARLRAYLVDGAAPNILSVRETGTATNNWSPIAVVVAYPGVTADFDQMLNTSQSFDYQLGAATGLATVYVLGFEE